MVADSRQGRAARRPDAAPRPSSAAPVDKLLLVARIGAPHGVRGEVRVKAFTDDPLAFRDYRDLSDGGGRSFRIERLRPAKDIVIAKFAGIDDRNAAETLNGTDLFVARSSLPDVEEDEFYHADLIGLEAYTEAEEPIGAVVAVHDFGAGDILEIAPLRGPSLLLPFTKAVVPEIDLAAGRLTVIAPPETEGGPEFPSEEETAE
jgi:16S rRNA processing protein RimM